MKLRGQRQSTVEGATMVDKTMLKRLALVASNATMMMMWARVLYIFLSNGKTLVDEETCSQLLNPALMLALKVSYLELATSLLGLTRSNYRQVMMFATVRAGVHKLIAPLTGCGSTEHLVTALCWSAGDVVRFGCFAIDSAIPQISSAVKSVRYTVGPLLFPLGAGGEMLMVIRAAKDADQPLLFLAAALWPVGFYPLMQQLLKQRRKHFSKKDD
jgi:hypothetical protein